MSQSRLMSLCESMLNIGIGYAVAVVAQAWIFPLFGFDAPLSDHLLIAGLFTLVSLARSYCVRRLFVRWGRA